MNKIKIFQRISESCCEDIPDNNTTLNNNIKLFSADSLTSFNKGAYEAMKQSVDTRAKNSKFSHNINLEDDSKKKKVVKKTTSNKEKKKSNTKYIDSYKDTSEKLSTTISEIDSMNTILNNEINTIVSSKTLKNKYKYLSDLLNTSGSLISNKITAIREINKTITDSHNLELKKNSQTKELEKDQDKAIIDMYNAFISTPIGTMNDNYKLPTINDIPNNQQQNQQMMYSNDINTDGFNSFMNNITPAQNMIIMENNPNIQTVVVYDAMNETYFFDVVDMQTFQSVPNADKPNAMFLENMKYDYVNGIARDTNLDISYKLITINNNHLSEY